MVGSAAEKLISLNPLKRLFCAPSLGNNAPISFSKVMLLEVMEPGLVISIRYILNCVVIQYLIDFVVIVFDKNLMENVMYKCK